MLQHQHSRLPPRQQLMGKRDLAAKYGTSKNLHQLINLAIRAEIPGGSAALDQLAALRGGGHLHQDCADGVREIVDAMGDEIRRRYGIGPPPDGQHARTFAPPNHLLDPGQPPPPVE